MSKAAEIVTCNETADAFQKLYYEKLDKQVKTMIIFLVSSTFNPIFTTLAPPI